MSAPRSISIVSLCLLLFVSVIGFAVAPAAAADDPGTLDQDDSSSSDEQVPKEVCTDIAGMVDEEFPYDQVVWFDELPDEAQPPGVPTDVITPEAIGGIVFNVVPNQCEVFDPNDPPFDPTDPPSDPDGGADVQEDPDNNSVLIIFNGTLNRSGDGPAAWSEMDVQVNETGELDPEAGVNDGEKDYAVDPAVRYWDDGASYFEGDVYVLRSTLGFELDCTGGECNPKLRGLPQFVDYPAFPAPGEGDGSADDGGGSDDSDDSDSDDSDDSSSDGADSKDDSGSSGTGGASSDGGDGSSSTDSGSDDSSSESSDDSGTDGSDDRGDADDSNDGDDSNDSNDGSDGATEETENGTDAQGTDTEADVQQQQAAGDGPGFGGIVALLALFASGYLAMRRS